MSVALAGRSSSTFEIKSASVPLLALRLKSADLALLTEEWAARYGEVPEFFDDDLLVLDLAALPAATEGETDIDFERLIALLRAQHLRPIAASGGSAAQMAAAAAAGLPEVPDMRLPAAAPAPGIDGNVGAAGTLASPAELPAPGALVIDRPLRSGQQVYARGRDLVVMAMVNHGAEVIADGHIHVYAPLRGRAIAGARGWGDARIFAQELRPELVSIAGVYRASDEPLAPSVWGHAATVRLVSSEDGTEKLVFEPMTG